MDYRERKASSEIFASHLKYTSELWPLVRHGGLPHATYSGNHLSHRRLLMLNVLWFSYPWYHLSRRPKIPIRRRRVQIL
ncbi:hypothetical protein HanPI659440_Chr03g0102881 [Helianthus annuus]|nr:hypothetical protein HanOQP8_Chr03g0093661 [Helianthus annuus]KAJ0800423.1 hypothetical protein HanPI659440_Chr03g0102881 [Helianthus annuus]